MDKRISANTDVNFPGQDAVEVKRDGDTKKKPKNNVRFNEENTWIDMDRHQYKLGFAKPHGANQQIPWG